MFADRRRQPIQSDTMYSTPINLSPRSSSDGESFHSTISASREETKNHPRSLTMKEDATRIEAPFVELSSPNMANQRFTAEAAVISGHFTIDEITPTQPRTPRRPCESPRKRRRSNAHPGPKAPIPHRRSSVPARRKGQDLISFHRQSCRLFQSLEGTLASDLESTTDSSQPSPRHGSISYTRPPSPCIVKTYNGFAYLTSPISATPRFGSTPRNSRRNSSAATTISTKITPPHSLYNNPAPTTISSSSSSFSSIAGTSYSILEEKSDSPPRRPHPISTTSWTSLESRRREYEQIDRENRGWRGWWKRVVPRRWRGRCARSRFFDGVKGDVGEGESVRRYRIELGEDDDTGEKQSGEIYKRRNDRRCIGLR